MTDQSTIESNAAALSRLTRLAPASAISEYSLAGMETFLGDEQASTTDEQVDILFELVQHVCRQLVNMREAVTLIAAETVGGHSTLTEAGRELLNEALAGIARLDDDEDGAL